MQWLPFTTSRPPLAAFIPSTVAKNSHMFDVFSMGVGIGINMGIETTYETGERWSRGYKIGLYLPLPANL
jgi:hypothetical protein